MRRARLPSPTRCARGLRPPSLLRTKPLRFFSCTLLDRLPVVFPTARAVNTGWGTADATAAMVDRTSPGNPVCKSIRFTDLATRVSTLVRRLLALRLECLPCVLSKRSETLAPQRRGPPRLLPAAASLCPRTVAQLPLFCRLEAEKRQDPPFNTLK